MKYVIAAVIAWLLAVVSVSAMPYIEVLGVTPDLVLIFAACWAVVREPDEAFVVVPIAAFTKDLMSSDPVGTSVIAFIPIVLLAAAVRIRALDSDFIPTIVVVATGTIAFEALHMMVLAVTGQHIETGYAVLHVAIPGAVVNALFCPVIYLPVRWFTPRRPSVLYGGGRLTSPL